MVDVIVVAIIAIICALSIYKIIQDKKNGVPSCGYACGSGCSSCSGSCSHGENEYKEKDLEAIRKRILSRSEAKS